MFDRENRNDQHSPRLYDEAYSGVKNVSNDDNAPSDNYDFESGGSREVTDRSDDEETSSNDDTTSTSTGSSSDENETDIDDDDDDENDDDDEDDDEEEQTTNKKVVDRLDNDNERPLNHGLANEQQTKVKQPKKRRNIPNDRNILSKRVLRSKNK